MVEFGSRLQRLEREEEVCFQILETLFSGPKHIEAIADDIKPQVDDPPLLAKHMLIKFRNRLCGEHLIAFMPKTIMTTKQSRGWVRPYALTEKGLARLDLQRSIRQMI